MLCRIIQCILLLLFQFLLLNPFPTFLPFIPNTMLCFLFLKLTFGSFVNLQLNFAVSNSIMKFSNFYLPEHSKH